eukprot:CAMPEP_0170641700 /NCGR_PEP_ID=MMETSP0224-20130122/40921_1 /TAXON_ID=285029 /ORGANISM="Togula jolla, Strain CCCM 725" /LENGTH=101 /DNA_ID=CAMNT_0010972337 /DNA_START=451 /DNA_END=757 /DNA_ORIENTATION=+
MRKAPLNAASSPWKSVSRPVTTQTVTAPQPAAKLPRRGSARQHRPIATAIKAASAKAEALPLEPAAAELQLLQLQLLQLLQLHEVQQLCASRESGDEMSAT